MNCIGTLACIAAAFAGYAGQAAAQVTDQPSRVCAGAANGHTRAGLYFQCTGTGAEVVILIPAFSMDVRMWAAQVDLLEASARVVAYDLRGHGKSVAAMEPYSAVDDLTALMDELGVKAAHLVGLSNGARIALDFALVHPARTRSLVLASPGVSGYTGGDFSYMLPVIEAIRRGDLDQAADLWAVTPLMHIPHDSAAAGTIRRISRDNRSIWSHGTNPERELSPPAISRLGDVRIPALVVSGDSDLQDLQRLADIVARTIPGAQHIVLRRAGHMVNLAASQEFNDAILAFLRRQGVR